MGKFLELWRQFEQEVTVDSEITVEWPPAAFLTLHSQIPTFNFRPYFDHTVLFAIW
jgi:hypothetical protein